MKVALALTCISCLLAATEAAGAGNAVAAGCDSASVVVWLDTTSDAAAGSVSYKLMFTNVSGRTCSLRGFPAVSAVAPSGVQVGPQARRNPSPAHTVTLRAGDSASAVVRVAHAVDFPPARCHLVTAGGFKVSLPGASAAKIVPFPFPTCSARTAVVLAIWAIS